jgi:membrane protease YdiL (CAAX protease family)
VIARATRDSVESPPTVRHPKAELLALILFGFSMGAAWVAARTGQFRLYATIYDSLANLFLSGIRSLPSPQTHEALFFAVWECVMLGLLPMLFLLSSGNELQSLGLRLPRGKVYLWAPIAVAGLPFMLLLAAAAGLFPGATAWARAQLGTQTLRLVCLVVGPGYSEELFFRAGVQSRLQLLLGSRPMAVLLSSWLFVLAHLGNMPERTVAEWLMASGTRMEFGIVLGYLFSRTASILPGILLHAAWDLIGG